MVVFYRINLMGTPRKYLAFDIETAKEVPGDFSQWREHRPLGIICAATCVCGAEPKLWHSRTDDGRPASHMSQFDVQQLVGYLTIMASQGYTILTWNGASFDFDVLAEESAARDDCRKCAHDHVDMMFHLVCMMGCGVKLQKAAEGLGLPGKAGGMTGAEVPRRWRDGDHERVFTYAEQDVRLALQVAEVCERNGEFAWISSENERKTFPLPNGWLTVREALQLPLPNRSLMTTKGMSREQNLAWMLG